MGEVGFPRKEFLYELKWWEIQAIIDGYRKRERTFLVMTRWATYMQMSTGMADLSKAGIHEPQDLMRFSWEEETDHSLPLTEEQQQAIREQLQAENRKNGVG